MTQNTMSVTSSDHGLCEPAIDPSLSDRELVTEFVRQHDQAAFTILVRRHASLVWSVCRRVLGRHADVEDAVQATFVLLSRKAAELKNPELVGAWLHAVARKVACKARSGKSRDRVLPLEQEVSQIEEPLDVLSGREVLAILDEELAQMPEEYRAVLLLCCIEGKSREEAGQQLGWSEGSVKGRLERGRELLRRRLSRRGLELSAVLAAALVWQTAFASDAASTFARILDSPPLRAVDLADAVAGSLGKGVSTTWGLVGAMLLTGAGVGAGIWAYGPAEPKPPPIEMPATQPNRAVLDQPEPKLKTDRRITVRQRLDSDPTVVQAAPLLGTTWTAVLSRVNPELKQITLRVREDERPYRLAQGVDIRIDGMTATVSELVALGGRPRVKVTLHRETSEVVSLAAEGETLTGTLQGVNADRNTITLRRRQTDPNASECTWPLSTGATLRLDGRPASLSEIHEGHPVTARLSADGKRVVLLDARSP